MSMPNADLSAEIAPAPPPPEPFVAAPRPPAPTTSRYVDASSDRVVLFPTAETHPSGTLFMGGYEFVLGNVGYAFTDHFELEGSYALGNLVEGALKLNVHRSTWLRFATVGAADFFLDSYGVPPIYRLSGIGTLCLSPDCWSSITLGAMGLASRSDLFPRRYSAIFDAGGILAVTRLIKLMLEPMVIWDPVMGPELHWSGGVRFSGEHWGLDLGVIPGSQELSPYLPWVSFTIRLRPGG